MLNRIIQRSLLIALCVLHLTAVAKPVVQTVAEFEAHYEPAQQAFALFDEGQADAAEQAMKIANAAVDADAEQADPYVLRGMLYLKAQQWNEARADLAKAFEIDPGHVLAAVLLAERQIRAAESAEAEATLDKALEKHPDQFSLLMTKAELRLAQRRTWLADDLLDKAIEVAQGDEQVAKANLQRALLYSQSKKLDPFTLKKAIGRIDQAIESSEQLLEPGQTLDPKFFVLRAYLFEIGQAYEEAAAGYRSLLQTPAIKDNAAQTKELKDRLVLLEQKIQAMRAERNQRLAGNVDTPICVRYPAAEEAHRLMRMRSFDAAMQAANDLVAKEPKASEPYTLRGEIYLAMGDAPAATEELQKALKIKPLDVPASALLVRAYAKRWDLERAKSTLDQVLAKHEKSLLLQLAEVDLLIANRKYNEVEKRLNSLITEYKAKAEAKPRREMYLPPLADAHYRFAIALRDLGGFEKARMATRRSIEADDLQHADRILTLGQLQEASSQYEEALKTYARFDSIIGLKQYPKWVVEIEARTEATQAKLDARREQWARADEDADRFIKVIDAYRANPLGAAARRAVIETITPYYATRVVERDTRMLVPLPQLTKEVHPENTSAPALIAARDAAQEIVSKAMLPSVFTREGGTAYRELADRIEAVYPDSRVLYYNAILAMEALDSEAAFENAMLAEAVAFAEFYHNRSESRVSEYGLYVQARALARLAYALMPNDYRLQPFERTMHQFFMHQKSGTWLEVDHRIFLRDNVCSYIERTYWDSVVARSWSLPERREAMEAAYYKKWNDVQANNNIRRINWIADRLLEKQIRHERLGYALLGHYSLNDDERSYELLITQLLDANPYNVYAWYSMANKAVRAKDPAMAALYFNAVAQFAKQGERPGPIQGIERDALRYLREAEATPAFADGIAQGYWTAAMDYQDKMRPQRISAKRWRPAVEAAAMRVIELAPNNPGIVDTIALCRLLVNNNEGAVEAAKQAMALDAELTGISNLRIGGAYENLGRAAKAGPERNANFTKSIAAYQKAVDSGAGKEAPIRMRFAEMYDLMKMIDKAIAEYRFVAENSDDPATQGRGYYLAATLSYKHETAPLLDIAAEFAKSTAAYDKAPKNSLSFVDRSNHVNSLNMSVRLQKEAEAASAK